jgi:hypothetical protein
MMEDGGEISRWNCDVYNTWREWHLKIRSDSDKE